MKLVIVHDAEGEILLLGRVAAPTRGTKKGAAFDAGFHPGPGQFVMELPAKGEFAKKAVDQIHREYRLDVKEQKLIRRED